MTTEVLHRFGAPGVLNNFFFFLFGGGGTFWFLDNRTLWRFGTPGVLYRFGKLGYLTVLGHQGYFTVLEHEGYFIALEHQRYFYVLPSPGWFRLEASLSHWRKAPLSEACSPSHLAVDRTTVAANMMYGKSTWDYAVF